MLFTISCSLEKTTTNTLYAFRDNLKKIKENLCKSFDKSSEWFYENYMVQSGQKCNFMSPGKKHRKWGFLIKYYLHQKLWRDKN